MTTAAPAPPLMNLDQLTRISHVSTRIFDGLRGNTDEAAFEKFIRHTDADFGLGRVSEGPITGLYVPIDNEWLLIEGYVLGELFETVHEIGERLYRQRGRWKLKEVRRTGSRHLEVMVVNDFDDPVVRSLGVWTLSDAAVDLLPRFEAALLIAVRNLARFVASQG